MRTETKLAQRGTGSGKIEVATDWRKARTKPKVEVWIWAQARRTTDCELDPLRRHG